jgi:hypothetical protein
MVFTLGDPHELQDRRQELDAADTGHGFAPDLSPGQLNAIGMRSISFLVAAVVAFHAV